MFIILSNSKYYKGNNSFTVKRKEAKRYKTARGARNAITRCGIKKARFERLKMNELSPFEQMEQFSNNFELNSKYDPKQGLIAIDKHIDTPDNQASKSIANLASVLESEPRGTLNQVWEKEI